MDNMNIENTAAEEAVVSAPVDGTTKDNEK